METGKPIPKPLDEIKRVVETYGDLFLLCATDKNGKQHFSDFGFETKVMKEIMPYFQSVSGVVAYYFERKNLEKERTYIFKFSINNKGVLTTESFGAIPKIPTLKEVA